MQFHAVIPYRPANPKTRLSAVLSERERSEFACAMLTDVVSALHEAGADVTLLSTESCPFPGIETVVRNDGLNEALDWYLAQCTGPVMIVMSDLPLVLPETLFRVISTKSDIAVVPGLGGGTNILYVRNPKTFRAQYYGFSFDRHCREAAEENLTVEVVDSMRMSTDVDEPRDLVELMIHGTGTAKQWLSAHDFVLTAETGRLRLKRGDIVVC